MMGKVVERSDSIKFLGIHIFSDLSWSENNSHLVKKAQQQLFFLRKVKRTGLYSAAHKLLQGHNLKHPVPQCDGVVWQLHDAGEKGLSTGSEDSTGNCGMSSTGSGLDLCCTSPEKGQTHCYRPHTPG
ncbi:hypothetical protein AMECASPLE_015744 [Ameca splendens]|uniref:Alkylated DNA repair protein AlkB homologue 8 N-terminal domain-containing protein n=1 Tax=Ameca splendens TaxID=208324 RepID=A0ABV0Z027_9TELE